MFTVTNKRGALIEHCLAMLAVVGMVIALAGCIPIPGTNISACVLCLHSQASTRVGAPTDTSAEAPSALPAIPGSILPPASNTPKASPSEASTAGGPPGEPPPASLSPASAPSEVEPTPAAPGAGVGLGVAPHVNLTQTHGTTPATTAGPATEPPPGPADPLAQTLRQAEGLSLTPYPDTGGVPHICYGHRITHATCDGLLAQDKADAAAGAERVVGEPTWSVLTERRRYVLAELAYMVGATGLSRFTEMLKALHAGDYAGAADEVILSTLKPPTRAVRLANLMREG